MKQHVIQAKEQGQDKNQGEDHTFTSRTQAPANTKIKMTTQPIVLATFKKLKRIKKNSKTRKQSTNIWEKWFSTI